MEDQVVRIRTPIELRAEVTWPSSNTLSTQDNHNLGKFDPSSGRASGQVEQVAAKALIDLGAEATWSSLITFSTQDKHDLGKFDLISGGAGEQVAAWQPWPSRSVPHSSVDKVLEDKAAVGAPLLKDWLAVEAPPLKIRIETPIDLSTEDNHALASSTSTLEELADRWCRWQRGSLGPPYQFPFLPLTRSWRKRPRWRPPY